MENAIGLAAPTLRQLKAGEPVTRSEVGALIFVLSQVRAVNLMAQALDVPKRVHILTLEEEGEQTDWTAILETARSILPKAGNLREMPSRPEPVLIPVVAQSP